MKNKCLIVARVGPIRVDVCDLLARRLHPHLAQPLTLVVRVAVLLPVLLREMLTMTNALICVTHSDNQKRDGVSRQLNAT